MQARLRKLIRPDKRSAVHFSDHVEGDGAKFFEAAADLGLEGIVSKRVASRYRSGPSRSWLKTKNMVESEFVLLGTDRDANGIPWALLATDCGGALEFAGPAILNPCQQDRGKWSELMKAQAVAKPPLKGLRQGSAQWLRPELRVRVRHLKTRGVLRHATVNNKSDQYAHAHYCPKTSISMFDHWTSSLTSSSSSRWRYRTRS